VSIFKSLRLALVSLPLVDLTYGRLFEISYGGSVCDVTVLLDACDKSKYPTERMLGLADIGKNFMMFLQVGELIIVLMQLINRYKGLLVLRDEARLTAQQAINHIYFQSEQ